MRKFILGTAMLLALACVSLRSSARPEEAQPQLQGPGSKHVSETQFVQGEGLSTISGGPVVLADFNNDGKPDILTGGFEFFQVLLDNGGGSFTALPAVSLGFDEPISIVTGDFNGDGKLDIAMGTEFGGSDFFLYEGNGDGTFQPRKSISAGDEPFYLVAGDFNHDGLLDIVAVDPGAPSVVYFLAGKGNGSFKNAVAVGTLNFSAVSVVAADFNNDGNLDLVVGTDGDVELLLGNGDGTFGPPSQLALNSYMYGEPLAVGDFNHDGKMDLALGNGSASTLDILLGKGDGTFQSPIGYPAPNPIAVLVAGNLDGSGHVSLAAQGDYGGLYVFTGKGNGSFDVPDFGYATACPNSQSLAISDLNGDGKQDIVATTGNLRPSVMILFGQGGGTFRGALDFASAPIGAFPGRVAEGDINGDGHMDIATTIPEETRDSSVTVYLGKGDGTFPAGGNATYDSGGERSADIFAQDLNGDGRADVVVVNRGGLEISPAGSVGVLLANSDGTLQPVKTYTAGAHPQAVVFGDFNGDGKTDLAVSAESSISGSAYGIYLLFGNGDGTFTAGPNMPLSTDFIDGLVVGDFNHDGKLDLAGSDGRQVEVLLGNGDGTFRPPIIYNFNSESTLSNSMAVGDFNGDGNLDLVLAFDSGIYHNHVAVALGNGNGTFQNLISTYPEFVSSSAIHVADLNGDGKLDVVVAQGSSQPGAAYLLGNGDGTFDAGHTLITPSYAAWTAVGDVNGDGAPDIVTLNFFDQSITVILNSGVVTANPR